MTNASAAVLDQKSDTSKLLNGIQTLQKSLTAGNLEQGEVARIQSLISEAELIANRW